MYAICWLPLHVLQLWGEQDRSIYEHDYSHLLWNTVQWVAMAHACCNPLIYFWMNNKFRNGFVRIFTCKKYGFSPRRQSEISLGGFSHTNRRTTITKNCGRLSPDDIKGSHAIMTFSSNKKSNGKSTKCRGNCDHSTMLIDNNESTGSF